MLDLEFIVVSPANRMQTEAGFLQEVGSKLDDQNQWLLKYNKTKWKKKFKKKESVALSMF